VVEVSVGAGASGLHDPHRARVTDRATGRIMGGASSPPKNGPAPSTPARIASGGQHRYPV